MPGVTDTAFIKALKRQPVPHTPIWIMRQAGRYLPEYRKVREQAGDFLSLCSNPELAAEVTLQPLRRFALDAAIIFSDILIIPHTMDLGLAFAKGEGPVFSRPVNTPEKIYALQQPDIVNDASYVYQALSNVKQELGDKTPIIGFAGSPWTVATYMIEGKGSKQYNISKKIMYSDPEAMRYLLTLLANTTIEYLKQQSKAGAAALMIFDTWGGVLAQAEYKDFSVAAMNQIVTALKADPETAEKPIILFTKGGGIEYAEILVEHGGSDAIGLDWTVNIADAYKRLASKVALQGNLDPSLLYAPKDVLKQKVTEIMTAIGSNPGHVFNLGHGIYPDVDPDQVAYLVDLVHDLGAHQ